MIARLLRRTVSLLVLGAFWPSVAYSGERPGRSSWAAPAAVEDALQQTGYDFHVQDDATISGTLRTTMGTTHRPGEYVLLDAGGRITHRVRPQAGVKLDSMVGRRVVVRGEIDGAPPGGRPQILASQVRVDTSIPPRLANSTRKVGSSLTHARVSPSASTAKSAVRQYDDVINAAAEAPERTAQLPAETTPLESAPPRFESPPAETVPRAAAPVESLPAEPAPAPREPGREAGEPAPEAAPLNPVPMDAVPNAAAPVEGVPLGSHPRSGAVVPEAPSYLSGGSEPFLDPGRPMDSNCCPPVWQFRPFGSVEYLLMTPRRRAFDYALSDPNTNDAPEGSMQSLAWDLASGIRFGGGVCGPTGWELGATFTTLNTSVDETIAAPAGGQLWTTLTHAVDVSNASTASATSSLDYQVLDVMIAKRLTVRPDFAVRVQGGFRYAWIDQEFDVLYDGLDADDTLVSSPVNMTAYGLRVGAEGDWRLANGFSLFGRAAGSVLIATFDTSVVETDNDGAETNVNVKESFTQGVPVIEVAVGVRKTWCHWQVDAGYELVNWGNMVDSRDFIDDLHEGKNQRRLSDLSLDGLFVRLAYQY